MLTENEKTTCERVAKVVQFLIENKLRKKKNAKEMKANDEKRAMHFKGAFIIVCQENKKNWVLNRQKESRQKKNKTKQ